MESFDKTLCDEMIKSKGCSPFLNEHAASIKFINSSFIKSQIYFCGSVLTALLFLFCMILRINWWPIMIASLFMCWWLYVKSSIFKDEVLNNLQKQTRQYLLESIKCSRTIEELITAGFFDDFKPDDNWPKEDRSKTSRKIYKRIRELRNIFSDEHKSIWERNFLGQQEIIRNEQLIERFKSYDPPANIDFDKLGLSEWVFHIKWEEWMKQQAYPELKER